MGSGRGTFSLTHTSTCYVFAANDINNMKNFVAKRNIKGDPKKDSPGGPNLTKLTDTMS